MKKILTLTILLFVSLLLISCEADTNRPNRMPDMGFVKVIDSTRKGDVLVVSMESNLDTANKEGITGIEKAKYSEATVTVNKNTKIFVEDYFGSERATTEDMLKAKYLEVWFKGPVRESDSLQATADTIFIID